MKTIYTFALIALIAALPLAAVEIPRTVPQFTVTSYDGRVVSLDDLKGKVVVAMFFSTTCPHCQNASRAMGPIYEELKAQGLEVVGFALNETGPSGLRAFAANYGASYPMAVSSRAEFSRISKLSMMARFYYPYLLFIDRNGNVQEEHQGAETAWFENLGPNFRSIVTKLLAE